METFTSKPSIPATIAYKPNVRSITLGDSFTTDIPIGINQNLKTYSLQFNNIQKDEALEIIDFLKRHGGHRTFIWIGPDNIEGLFRCKNWRESISSGGFRSISLFFDEVLF